jgi:hypothetical protein
VTPKIPAWGLISAMGVAAYYLSMKQKLKQEGSTKKMMILNEDTFQFFNEVTEIRSTTTDEEIEPGRIMSVFLQLGVQVIAHYTEGTGVLCVDLETRLALKHHTKGRKPSFFDIGRYMVPDLDVPRELRERRLLLTKHDHAQAVRFTVQATDAYIAEVKAWSDENFHKIKAKPVPTDEELEALQVKPVPEPESVPGVAGPW